MNGTPVMLWWMIIALAVTWWSFFRKRITICVSGKARDVIRLSRSYRGVYAVYHAYRYTLTDCSGHTWIVSKAAYERAVPGERIELRQWVDEWRPVGTLGRYTSLR